MFFSALTDWGKSLIGRLLIAEDEGRPGMTGAKRAASAMSERDFAIRNLARTAFAAQLLDRLDHQEHSTHPRMVRREPTTVGIDRKIAVVAQASATDKG